MTLLQVGFINPSYPDLSLFLPAFEAVRMARVMHVDLTLSDIMKLPAFISGLVLLPDGVHNTRMMCFNLAWSKPIWERTNIDHVTEH